MKEKIIIKLIYFLLRFVKQEISSHKLFNEKVKELAKGEYCTSSIEITNYLSGSKEIVFTNYIHGYKHQKGRTMEQSLDRQKRAMGIIKEDTVNTIID